MRRREIAAKHGSLSKGIPCPRSADPAGSVVGRGRLVARGCGRARRHDRGVVNVPAREYPSQRAAPAVGDKMHRAGPPLTGRSHDQAARTTDSCDSTDPLWPVEGRPVLMRACDRRIDPDHSVQLPGGVGLALDPGEQPISSAVLGPPGEPVIDQVPLPEPLRHLSPRAPVRYLHAIPSTARQ